MDLLAILDARHNRYLASIIRGWLVRLNIVIVCLRFLRSDLQNPPQKNYMKLSLHSYRKPNYNFVLANYSNVLKMGRERKLQFTNLITFEHYTILSPKCFVF